MIELTILACLIASPATCEPPRRIPVEAMTPQQCLAYGERQAALWLGQELGPRYRIVKITCGRRVFEREA